MKIYTKTGDFGDTSLFGGQRLPKHHIRIDAYGTVDETNAFLGLAATRCSLPDLTAVITRVQAELFEVGADLATPLDAKTAYVVRIEEDRIQRLEAEIDAWENDLPPLQNFILPGGSETGAALHIARTVCRRAERAVAALAAEEAINELTLRYLNRLSDWLFVLARVVNHRLGQAETPWRPANARGEDEHLNGDPHAASHPRRSLEPGVRLDQQRWPAQARPRRRGRHARLCPQVRGGRRPVGHRRTHPRSRL